MFKGIAILTAFVIFLFGTLAQAQKTSNTAQPSQAPTASMPKPATQDPNYIIGPQDVLDINVWREQELTRAVPVRPDGKISLPLLNDVQAAGLTPMQLSQRITEGLKKFVADPQVTVLVTEINSQRIYILGEVNHPGAFAMLPGMNMLEALSSAGGFTMFAHVKKIYLLRKVNGTQEKYMFNYKDVIHGKTPEQNLVLKAGDTIVVP